MAGVSYKSEQSETCERQNRSNLKVTGPQNHERAELFSGINSTLIQIYKQPFQKDRQHEKTTKEKR